MQLGAGPPEAPISVARRQNAALSQQDKALASDSTQKSPGSLEVLRTLQRLSGRCFDGGGRGRVPGRRKGARIARGGRESEKTWKRERKEVRTPKKRRMGDGQMPNGPNRRAGLRNRSYICDCEYHLAPKRTWRDARQSEIGRVAAVNLKAHRTPSSTIPIDAPEAVQSLGRSSKDDGSVPNKQSLATTFLISGPFMLTAADRVVVLDTGAAANMARFCRLGPRNRIWVQSYPACIASRF